MKLSDVSQLPVMRDGRIVGIVDEEDILLEVADHPDHFREPVTEAMESRLVTVPPAAPGGLGGEEDLRREVPAPPDPSREPVTEAMESRLVTVPPDAPVERLMEIFKQ